MREIFRVLRELLWHLRYLRYRHCRRIDLDRSSRVGSGVIFDRTFPLGIHIGRHTYVTNNVTILSHDHSRSAWNLHTRIGSRCFIGNHSIILAGVFIGDEVIVGAGSVVTKDVPSHCIVAGNPARIIRTGIRMNDDARLICESEDRDPR